MSPDLNIRGAHMVQGDSKERTGAELDSRIEMNQEPLRRADMFCFACFPRVPSSARLGNRIVTVSVDHVNPKLLCGCEKERFYARELGLNVMCDDKLVTLHPDGADHLGRVLKWCFLPEGDYSRSLFRISLSSISCDTFLVFSSNVAAHFEVSLYESNPTKDDEWIEVLTPFSEDENP